MRTKKEAHKHWVSLRFYNMYVTYNDKHKWGDERMNEAIESFICWRQSM